MILHQHYLVGVVQWVPQVLNFDQLAMLV